MALTCFRSSVIALRYSPTLRPCLFSNSIKFTKSLKMLPKFCTKVIPQDVDAILDTVTILSTFDKTKTSQVVVKKNNSDVFGSMKKSWERNNQIKKEKKTEVTEEKVIQIQEEDVIQTQEEKKIYKQKRKKNQVKKVDDSDQFGSLSDKNEFWYSPLESDTEIGSDFKLEFPLEKKFKTAKEYLKEMKILVKERKLKEALELFPDMKRNRIFPISSNYTYMIGACGRAGYTDMAFKLLKQMTDRGFRPTSATLTGLFNSCAESPFPELGLRKSKFLKEKIAAKNWELAQPTYHAMIKSFGRCGDLEMAFQLVDEMVEAGFRISATTYSFLFMSCIADKEAGFTHAIEVWRKMLSKKIRPALPSFNLLLRAVRDCNIGPDEVSSLLLQHWSSYRKRPYGFNNSQKSISTNMLMLPYSKKLALESGSMKPITNKDGQTYSIETSHNSRTEIEVNVQPSVDIETSENQSISSENMQKFIPNVLMKRPVDGPVFVDLVNVRTAEDRLALVGNPDGFLNLMKSYNVKPDIRTFTIMLECVSRSVESENQLISLLDASNVKPDVDFFNILIKKRNLRRDYESAKDVLVLLRKYNLSPDVVTFGVLALGCHGAKAGTSFLQDMKKLGHYPNIEIMGGLIHHACINLNFSYLETLLKVLKSEDILPNERILKKIEEAIEIAREKIIAKEQKNEWSWNFPFENFLQSFQAFGKFYSQWLEESEIELEPHPWKQYETDIMFQEQKVE